LSSRIGDLDSKIVRIGTTVDALISWKEHLESTEQLEPSPEIPKLIERLEALETQLGTLDQKFTETRAKLAEISGLIHKEPI